MSLQLIPQIPLFKVRWDAGIGDRVDAVGASGYIGQGELCEQFEREFGRLVDALDPPLLVNSCTSAIDLACHLIGVGPGDEVVTSPITCTATNSPPALRGARLVWADVDPLTGNIDPLDVERKRTRATKAVIAVDWAGRCAVTRDLKLAAGGTYIIEDAAHALLAESAQGPIAQWGGDYTCWSFQAIKHLSLVDGGALLPPASQIERTRLLRWYGLDRRSKADFRCEQDIREIGYKYQSNDVAAAIGLANLARAEWAVARSRLNAEWYTRALAGVPGVALAPFDPGASYWIFTILVDDRDAFSAHLKERGIATSQVHARNDKHSAFKAAGEARGPLPGVDYFDAHQVAIPNGYWVGEREREQVASAIHDWAHGRREAA
jgi:dTDP-4-amino-4,6-dideoxygalactose transaminase